VHCKLNCSDHAASSCWSLRRKALWKKKNAKGCFVIIVCKILCERLSNTFPVTWKLWIKHVQANHCRIVLDIWHHFANYFKGRCFLARYADFSGISYLITFKTELLYQYIKLCRTAITTNLKKEKEYGIVAPSCCSSCDGVLRHRSRAFNREVRQECGGAQAKPEWTWSNGESLFLLAGCSCRRDVISVACSHFA